ncbi:MAG TPA: hypothetical protein VFJ84_02280 [Candidatus Saccharimonadales bacterium]|nr:hypothetical protein [Candidatus Saccharimonadales bacterium]
MNIARKAALGILSPLFVLLLFATAFDIGFINVAAHPEAVKQLVAESGVYDSIVPNILKQQGNIATPLGNISASNPAVQKAVSQAITPQEVRKNAEAAIDGVYAWLDGKTARPDFSFNLAGQQADFADSVAASVQNRLASLPACTYSQSLVIARSGSFDIEHATCLPQDISAAGAARQVKTYLRNNSDFLNNMNVDAASLKNSSGQSVFEQPGVRNIPTQYQRAKKTPVILAVLTVLAGAGIVFLSRSRQAGLRHIGLNLLVIGAVMLVFSWSLNRVMSNEITPKIRLDNAVLQSDLRRLATDISQRIDRNYWIFGSLYAVLGAGAFAGSALSQRRTNPLKASSDTPAKSS